MNSINFSQMTKDYDPTMYRDSISQKLFELLEEYTRTFSKTMFVRFDVTYPKTYIVVEDNSDMSALMKLLIQQCSRNGRSGFTSLDQSTAKLRWTVLLVMPPI